ncbi:Endo-chitosanase like protein [Verticillium longisporum]|uniref:Endo-chitosanase n=2 Tax=Verticillium TaxID=1036719 RepID=A0A8I3ASE3_VERLO|nr:Endo-chitosanase like protein [Verticillium longisporum]
MILAKTLIATAALSTAIARDIPNNLRSFYNHIRDQKQCKNALATGFHSSDGDSGDFDYCGDYLEKYNIVYLQGRNGELVNLDIDCDGIQGGPADDGRCGSSGDTQSQTSFQEDLQSYGANQTDLDANVHPYVVFGNESEENKKGWPTFDPSAHGIEPLSIMAVVCNDQLYYGIWGDTNGDDGDEAMVGEASISLATLCFGNSMNGDNGHDDNDVLFIAFTGSDAVPGNDGADWAANNATVFQESITERGNKLVERIGSAAPCRTSVGSWLVYGAVATVAGALILWHGSCSLAHLYNGDLGPRASSPLFLLASLASYSTYQVPRLFPAV